MKRVLVFSVAAFFVASLVAQQPTPGVEEVRARAEQGEAEAQYTLGLWYETGTGEAAKWYRKSAEQGYFRAQDALGALYYNGNGVPQNYAEAAEWYRKAAEQGDYGAQFNLGVMYHNGEGVPQNYVQEHKWLNLAASRASGQDAEKYRKARELVAKKMTPDQIAEAQRLAREWKPKTWEELKAQAAEE